MEKALGGGIKKNQEQLAQVSSCNELVSSVDQPSANPSTNLQAPIMLTNSGQAEVMHLKCPHGPELIENGNKQSTLESLADDTKIGSDALASINDTVKWELVWSNKQKSTSFHTEEPTISGNTTPDLEETEESSSSCPSGSDSEGDRGGIARGFSNPNYPGFSHLAHELEDNFNNNSSNINNKSGVRQDEKEEIDWVNRTEGCQQVKKIYTRCKLELGGEIKESNMAVRASGKREKDINNSLKRSSRTKEQGEFDVYNIETAMPKIDLEAIESHLRAAREEERRRRNDREEIRRRLATGDSEDYYGSDKPGRKPSLQARLQSGMNLQICFMNETNSDTESPSSENAPPSKNSQFLPVKSKTPPQPPKSLNLPNINVSGKVGDTETDSQADFFTRQARLQAEARLALGQAKERARAHMEEERLKATTSPITLMLRTSLAKVGIRFPEERRRLSRQMLTDMNVAQLQVIVNDLHTQIETLNENLVKYLMERDELHMSQDSMLVDIEDITRYLGAKESVLMNEETSRNNNMVEEPGSVRPELMTRIVSPASRK